MNRRRVLQQANLDKDMVIMTSDTNPKILRILYNAGLCASPDVMYKSEAEVITISELPEAFEGADVNESFDAFKYFTSVTQFRTVNKHPGFAIFNNAGFTSIQFPDSLISLAAAHWLDKNRIAFLTIPARFNVLPQYGPGYSPLIDKISVYFESTVPPSLSGNFAMDIGLVSHLNAIYVPDSAVETYLSAYANVHMWGQGSATREEWLALIKPISEYTNS